MSILPRQIGKIFDSGLNRFFDSSEIHSLVADRAHQFANLNLVPGDKVLLCHGNSIEFFVDLFACWTIGACAVPVDPAISEPELCKLAGFTEATLILHRFSDEFAERLRRNPNFPFPRLYHTQRLAPSDSSRQLSPLFDSKLDFDLDSEALILFTSGSTSEPKGVVHSFRSILAKIAIASAATSEADWRNTLCILPTHFVYGLVSNSLVPLFFGHTLFIYPPFNLSILSDLSSLIQRLGITAFCSVPSMWKIVFEFSPTTASSELKRIHCAAAPLSKSLWSQICAWAPNAEVKNVYGATEMCCAVTGPLDGMDFHDGLVGRGWNTKVAVLNDVGQPALANEVGEVFLQGPSMMKGYFKRPDATAEVLRRGWYRTGDLGFADSLGDVTLVGRSKYVINKAGMKIYPEDVETLLMTFPEITDACVFALPDPISGETVAAAVVFKGGSKPSSLNDLESWMRKNIAPFKVPSKWFALPSLPRTSRGKINRTTLIESLKV